MGDFPTQLVDSIYDAVTSVGLIPDAARFGVFGSRSWFSANAAMFIPFGLDEARTAVQLMDLSGNTPGGNLDFGIYDFQGNKIVSSGSVAQVSGPTVGDIADTLLQPGYYFMALAHSTANDHSAANASATFLATYGVCTAASAFPLPSTFTPVLITTNYYPSLAVHFKAF